MVFALARRQKREKKKSERASAAALSINHACFSSRLRAPHSYRTPLRERLAQRTQNKHAGMQPYSWTSRNLTFSISLANQIFTELGQHVYDRVLCCLDNLSYAPIIYQVELSLCL